MKGGLTMLSPDRLSQILLADIPVDILAMQQQAGMRPAAVMLLLIGEAGPTDIVFTLRATHLKQHAGQVSFPGGKLDPADAGDLRQTALRECSEEIGWPCDRIDVLGYLPTYLTGTDYLIQPVVGYSPVAPPTFLEQLDLQQDEVASVWTQPLHPFLDMERYLSDKWESGEQIRHFYKIADTDPMIWGATASIMLSFARIVKDAYR